MHTEDGLLREIARLQEENAHLKSLLDAHGIDYVHSGIPPYQQKERLVLSLEEKVALFFSLFKGREDVFARRWCSTASGKSGYQPVCLREWNREYCDKKKFKCAECPNREFKELGYITIRLLMN